MCFTVLAVIFTLCLPGLINFICTRRGVRLLSCFWEALETLELSKITESVWVFDGFRCLIFSAYRFASSFFLDCRWFSTASILLIDSLVAIVWWSGIAEPDRSLPGAVRGLNKMSLYTLICLLPIANQQMSVIWACSCALCRFLSTIAFCFCSACFVFFNQAFKLEFDLWLLMSH